MNSAVDKVKKGENQNCRFYDIERMKCVLYCSLVWLCECLTDAAFALLMKVEVRYYARYPEYER